MQTDEQRLAVDDLFGPLADEYETWYATPLGTFVIAEEERLLVEAVPGAAGRLLDVGAGTGWWSRVLARRGFRVTAVEPSAAMRLVGAARGNGSIEWLAGRAERLPVPGAAFDVVVMMTVLEFVAEPERAMAEAWQALRPGGTLVVGHLDAFSPWAALYRHLADRGVAPWSGARFVESAGVVDWLGRPADARTTCVFLAPGANPPFEAADQAGRLAGNAGALAVLRWRKPS